MRRFLSVLLTICILVTLFTLPAMAEGSVSIDEIYYKISGSEIDKLQEGTIRPTIVINNGSGEAKEVNVFSALFSSESRIESIKIASGIVSEGKGEYFGPQMDVEGTQGKELRTFVWEKDSFAPMGGMRTLTDAEPSEIESITLIADDTKCEGIINETAKTVTFPVTAYAADDAASSMPDLSAVDYDVAGMDMDVVSEDGKTYLVSTSNSAPTKKYEVKTENWILQKSVDFDNLAQGAASGSADGGRGQAGTISYTNVNQCGIYAKPKDGSDETETGNNAYKFVGYSDNTKLYLTTDTSNLSEKVSEISFKFDMRIDDFGTDGENSFAKYGQLHVSQGLADGNYPYEMSMAFGNATAKEVVDTTKLGENQYSFGYSISRASGGKGKIANAPVLDMKKWYSFEILFKIDNATGKYSYEFFVDGVSAGKIENCFTKGAPSALVSGKGYTAMAASAFPAVYNFTAFARKQVGETAYFDNISVEYKRADEIPNVYILGDSLMADYAPDSVRRGWGEFIGDYFDGEQVRFQNMAKSGHRASFYLKGGNNAASGNKWYGADWYAVESQIKEGDYVIISVGYNDSIRPASECTDAADLQANLETLISKAKATGATVYVASEPPHIGSFTDANSSAYMKFSEKSCNEKLKNAAEAKGAVYIDLSAEATKEFNSYVSEYINENFAAAKAENDDLADEEVKSMLDIQARDMIYFGNGTGILADASSVDWTHYEEIGASLIAKAAANLIKAEGGELATYAKGYVAEAGNDTSVKSATLTVGGHTFEGIINNTTKEITFYPHTFRMNNITSSGAQLYATDNDLALSYPANIKTATVTLESEGTVDKNGVAVDLSDGNQVDFKITAANGDSVNYKVSAVESALSIYSHFNGSLRQNEAYRWNLPTWDNIIKTVNNVQYNYGNTTFRWISDEQKPTVTTALTLHEDSTTNKYFTITKSEPSVGRGFYAYLGDSGNTEKTVDTVVTSYDLMIEDLNGGRGFFAGLGGKRQLQSSFISDDNQRQALVFTRENLGEISTGIELKYVDNYKNNTLKDIPDAPILEFGKWYNIVTVQKDSENGDAYTTTMDIYVDGEYIGQVSSDYTDKYVFNIQAAFGGWSETGLETTYSVRLDNLAVMTDIGTAPLHEVKLSDNGKSYVVGDAITSR